MNKNIDKNIDKIGVPDSKKKDTASLFLMALLLTCIATGLFRGIKVEPRNKQDKKTRFLASKT